MQHIFISIIMTLRAGKKSSFRNNNYIW